VYTPPELGRWCDVISVIAALGPSDAVVEIGAICDRRHKHRV
jgi:hypothetical protein